MCVGGGGGGGGEKLHRGKCGRLLVNATNQIRNKSGRLFVTATELVWNLVEVLRGNASMQMLNRTELWWRASFDVEQLQTECKHCVARQ